MYRAEQAQHERASNSFLRMENDKIRCENITMRGALKNAICPSCVGQPVTDYFDEQNLRMENTQLKQEVMATGLTTAGHVVCFRRPAHLPLFICIYIHIYLYLYVYVYLYVYIYVYVYVRL